MDTSADGYAHRASAASPIGSCRFCATPLRHLMVDLGMSPLCESYLTAEQLDQMEPFYPLRAYVCQECFLVQVKEYVSPAAIFDEYAYFSSYSESWLAHARAYTDTIVERLGLGAESLVLELGSNDGYLLRHFRRLGISVLGVEPAANVAAVAETNGVPTEVAYFGTATARRLAAGGRRADLIVANNVLAHVPDLNDFVAGLPILLKPSGTVTVEFPHLLRLIAGRQFDTIYHEHFSYFSLLVADRVFRRHGLHVFDVDRLPTHGGSLRIHACHAGAGRPRSERIAAVLAEETRAGLTEPAGYTSFAADVIDVKCQVLEFLIGARRAGRSVAGYGAPAKATTTMETRRVRSVR